MPTVHGHTGAAVVARRTSAGLDDDDGDVLVVRRARASTRCMVSRRRSANRKHYRSNESQACVAVPRGAERRPPPFGCFRPCAWALPALVNSATPVVNVPYVRTSSRRRSRSRSELPATHAAMERGRTPRCARCGACSRSGSSGSAAAQQGTVTALLHTTSRRSSSRTHAASWILELSPEEQRAADAHYPRLVCRFANRRREDEALRWCYLSLDGDALPGDALGPRSRSLLVPQPPEGDRH